ncbi:DUF4129 domain-containing protein [Mycolicibacterium sediminis]|uniref:Protein-glutamine gamma-glutamyltransferase-like C-terminal domain-containing protein n=1 Tax=Mycolicibacterium sediminis TaxID=1286180 RepID=A0A7I7QLD8_9MYCO|nr:DUF4129 domain-containing protein [Mycolicibacterium sediminis]BBY26686.1 hypothetical protein MSEDJ_07820 [Mycolicibacterium sediminis]
MAETSTGRATASVAMAAGCLALVTLALRGHMPGGEPALVERTPDDPVAAVVVITLLAAAVAVVTVAVVVRVRRPAAGAARVAGRLDWMRVDRGGPARRTWLIAFGAVLLWVLVVAMLSRLTLDATPQGSEPDPPATSAPAAESPPPPSDADAADDPVVSEDWNLLGYFYAVTAAFLVVIVAGSVVGARRRPRAAAPVESVGPPATPLSDAESENLARAAEVGLAAVGDLTLDPRSSIIACWAAMEHELARVPGASPRDFDTASEVLARAVDLNALRPDSATELVDLFEEARFSPHVMTERHREAAVGVLQRVLDELGSRV